MFGPFQIIQLSPKKWFATFWAILWKIGQLFIRSPGHSDRIKLVMWLATPGRTGRNRRTRLVVVQKVFAVVAFWRNAGGRSKIFTQIRRPSFEKRRVYECDLAVRDVAEATMCWVQKLSKCLFLKSQWSLKIWHFVLNYLLSSTAI